MHRTEKLVPFEDDRRNTTPIMIASVLVVLGVGYVLLLMHPELVNSAGRFWHARVAPGSSAGWVAPTFAAGVAIGGAALGVYVLSSFVKGVQRAPYVWLAPVLVGFSCLVLARASIELPVPGVDANLFAAFTALLWLGGGAIVQQPGWRRRAAGALLLTLPVAVFACAQVQHAGGIAQAWPALGAPGRFFAFVLVLGWFGVGFMAFVTQDRVAHRGFAELEHARSSLHGAQARVAELAEHAHQSEMRASAAEQRAALAEHQLARLSVGGSPIDEQAFAELAKPRMPWAVKASAAVLVATGLAAAGYFGLYLPMAKRLASQSAAGASIANKHAAEIDALRRHFEAQRDELSAAVALQEQKAAQAEAELATARDELAALKTQADAIAAERSPTGKAAATKPPRARKRPARAAKPTRAAKRGGAARQSAERSDGADIGGRVDDDPIGGLL